MKLSFIAWKSWTILSLIAFFGMAIILLMGDIDTVYDLQWIIYVILISLGFAFRYGYKHHTYPKC